MRAFSLSWLKRKARDYRLPPDCSGLSEILIFRSENWTFFSKLLGEASTPKRGSVSIEGEVAIILREYTSLISLISRYIGISNLEEFMFSRLEVLSSS